MSQSMRGSTLPQQQTSGLRRAGAAWQRLMAPPDPPPGASKAQRELAWRGQLASIFLPVVLLLVLAPIPTALNNPPQLITLITISCVYVMMFFLNRAGKVTLVGVIVVMCIEFGLIASIVTTPGYIGLSDIPLFDLLVQALMVAIALLSPWWVFAVAGCNILFIVIAFVALPHAQDLNQQLARNFGAIIEPAIILEVILAFLLFILMQRLLREINRADSAEAIAELERKTLEQQQREIELKNQLEVGIQEILTTHVQVSNGNFSARVPAKQGSILWQIAFSLNNLLARLQDYDLIKRENEQMRRAILRYADAVRQAKGSQQPLKLEHTGTPLDGLLVDLNNVSLQPSQRAQSYPSASAVPGSLKKRART